jgi:hypothetical protein
MVVLLADLPGAEATAGTGSRILAGTDSRDVSARLLPP